MRFTIIPAAALCMAMSASPLMAQQAPQAPQPAPRQEAPAPDQGKSTQQAMAIEGELVRVDVDAKRLWVRSSEGEKQFTFTDQTEITGEGRNVEGLATMAGTRVKVEYKSEGTSAVATKIDIQPRSEQPAPRSPQPQQ
jgi:hypothetical protein